MIDAFVTIFKQSEAYALKEKMMFINNPKKKIIRFLWGEAKKKSYKWRYLNKTGYFTRKWMNWMCKWKRRKKSLPKDWHNLELHMKCVKVHYIKEKSIPKCNENKSRGVNVFEWKSISQAIPMWRREEKKATNALTIILIGKIYVQLRKCYYIRIQHKI